MICGLGLVHAQMASCKTNFLCTLCTPVLYIIVLSSAKFLFWGDNTTLIYMKGSARRKMEGSQVLWTCEIQGAQHKICTKKVCVTQQHCQNTCTSNNFLILFYFFFTNRPFQRKKTKRCHLLMTQIRCVLSLHIHRIFTVNQKYV